MRSIKEKEFGSYIDSFDLLSASAEPTYGRWSAIDLFNPDFEASTFAVVDGENKDLSFFNSLKITNMPIRILGSFTMLHIPISKTAKIIAYR